MPDPHGDSADDAAAIEMSWAEPPQFAVLFDRHAPHIYRYIARRVGHSAVDDLVAEVFVAAFASRHRYDLAYRDARPWLYGIATNIIGSHRRDELRQFRIIQAVGPQAPSPGHADQVASDVAARSISGHLATALAGLADGDRDVLVLIAWEELTYEEVARALRIPVGTVRSRLYRARSQLRLVLDESSAAPTIEEVMTHE